MKRNSKKSGNRENGEKEEGEIKKRISNASAKEKGRKFQQWACQQISDLLGIPWGKDELIASREASQTGTDVRLVGEARDRFPFAVECKWQESWDVPAWIRQARENETEGTDWLLLMKKNRFEPVVVMDAERFFALLRRIQDDNKSGNRKLPKP